MTHAMIQDTCTKMIAWVGVTYCRYLQTTEIESQFDSRIYQASKDELQFLHML